MNETQKRINSLLYLAYNAYNTFKYFHEKFDDAENSRRAEIYEAHADEYYKKAKIYLKCWSIMSGMEISIVELNKFNDYDFTEEITSIIEA